VTGNSKSQIPNSKPPSRVGYSCLLNRRHVGFRVLSRRFFVNTRRIVKQNPRSAHDLNTSKPPKLLGQPTARKPILSDGLAAPGRPFNFAERTAVFGEEIIRLARKIPRDPANDRLIRQVVGAGTSVGANFCEASDSESKKDFRHNARTHLINKSCTLHECV